MTPRTIQSIGFYIVLLMVGFWATTAFGVELVIPAITAQSGETVTIPIKIDQVENLAGVKLVMKYDADLLVYKKGDRTASTASLMHIVNDKKPGILILVMAGAKGIAGKDISIFFLAFETKKGIKSNHRSEIVITECQLMSDQLKTLPCDIKSLPITIMPSK